jgi:hypothetical protein
MLLRKQLLQSDSLSAMGHHLSSSKPDPNPRLQPLNLISTADGKQFSRKRPLPRNNCVNLLSERGLASGHLDVREQQVELSFADRRGDVVSVPIEELELALEWQPGAENGVWVQDYLLLGAG